MRTRQEYQRSVFTTCGRAYISVKQVSLVSFEHDFDEHMLHAVTETNVLLSICFDAFVFHGFSPSHLTDT